MSDSSNDNQLGNSSNQPPHSKRSAEADSEESWLDLETELSQSIGDSNTPIPTTSQLSSSPLRSRPFGPSSPLMMVETAFLASAASLIWLINFYFPLGPVLRILFPLPIALIYLRWNSRAAWMGALVSGLLLSVLMGPPRSILFVMPFGIMGVLLGLFWRRNASWSASVGINALLSAIGFFFRIWLTSVLLGEDLWTYATTQVTDMLEWLFVKLGLLIQPSLWLVQLGIVLVVLINSVVYVFVVHLVAWFLFDRLRTPIPRPPKWVQVLMDYE